MTQMDLKVNLQLEQ